MKWLVTFIHSLLGELVLLVISMVSWALLRPQTSCAEEGTFAASYNVRRSLRTTQGSAMAHRTIEHHANDISRMRTKVEVGNAVKCGAGVSAALIA